MQTGWQGNFFEDFTLNQAIPGSGPRTITEGDVALYIALTGDRTAAFCGPARLVHPLVTFHTVFGQTVRTISLNARANLGYAELRFGAPVAVGDTLRAEMRITGLKENSSRTTGVVYVETIGRNQRDEIVLSYARWVMVKKRGEAPTAWLDAPVVPALAAHVDATQIDVSGALAALAAAGRGCLPWERYEVGERILHHDGVLVNPSEHMAFTRLFQNSAKVHFDPLITGGKPLVYGGVVISHGYAASLNGLDDRLGLGAINAGQHANPVYAGDTLYACTDVIARAETSDPRVGALRLRLLVTKDVNPAQVEGFAAEIDDPERPGRRRLRPDIVLDLDYWELVRRG